MAHYPMPYATTQTAADALAAVQHDDEKAAANMAAVSHSADPFGIGHLYAAATAELDGTPAYRLCRHGLDICDDCGNVPSPGYEHCRRPYVTPAGFVTIAIGRSVGNHGDPMGPNVWDRFRLSVDRLLNDDDETFAVVGQSVSAEHGAEETYIAGGNCNMAPAELEDTLGRMADIYGQTAISLNYGGLRIVAKAAGHVA